MTNPPPQLSIQNINIISPQDSLLKQPTLSEEDNNINSNSIYTDFNSPRFDESPISHYPNISQELIPIRQSTMTHDEKNKSNVLPKKHFSDRHLIDRESNKAPNKLNLANLPIPERDEIEEQTPSPQMDDMMTFKMPKGMSSLQIGAAMMLKANPNNTLSPNKGGTSEKTMVILNRSYAQLPKAAPGTSNRLMKKHFSSQSVVVGGRRQEEPLRKGSLQSSGMGENSVGGRESSKTLVFKTGESSGMKESMMSIQPTIVVEDSSEKWPQRMESNKSMNMTNKSMNIGNITKSVWGESLGDINSEEKCVEHPEKKITLICKNCEQLICWKCLSSEHKSHQIVDLETYGQQFSLDLEEDIETVGEALEDLNKDRMRLNELKGQFLKEFSSQMSCISNTQIEMNKMKGTLQKHQKSIAHYREEEEHFRSFMLCRQADTARGQMKGEIEVFAERHYSTMGLVKGILTQMIGDLDKDSNTEAVDTQLPPGVLYYPQEGSDNLFLYAYREDRSSRYSGLTFNKGMSYVQTPGGQVLMSGGIYPGGYSSSTSALLPLGESSYSVQCRQDMISPKYNHALCVVHETLIYSVGGNNGRAMRECEKEYEGEWLSVPLLLTPRASPTVVVFNSKYIYAFGGYANNKYLDSIEVLEIGLESKGWWLVNLKEGGGRWFQGQGGHPQGQGGHPQGQGGHPQGQGGHPQGQGGHPQGQGGHPQGQGGHPQGEGLPGGPPEGMPSPPEASGWSGMAAGGGAQLGNSILLFGGCKRSEGEDGVPLTSKSFLFSPKDGTLQEAAPLQVPDAFYRRTFTLATPHSIYALGWSDHLHIYHIQTKSWEIRLKSAWIPH